jgi:hypothetical protein
MALSRKRTGRPFTEEERKTNELVAPHLIAAARRARLGHLRRATRLVDAHGSATALLNRKALVLEADEALFAVMRRARPQWSGPWMPEELHAAIAREHAFRVVQPRIVLRFDAVDDGLLLPVRAAGLPMRSPHASERSRWRSRSATRLARSPSASASRRTVRRHLANVYEKLGISSKTELDRMIRDVE